MRIINPSFEIIEQEEDLQGIYKQIELAGRTCYKSEDKITETSASEFVDRMVKSGHGAMLEHGTVYLHMTDMTDITLITGCKYKDNKYSTYAEVRVTVTAVPFHIDRFITTNYRVLLQGHYKDWDEAFANNFDRNWLDDLQYLCKPNKLHDKRITVKFNTQIAISREFNRHRVNSIAEESTRYCNYEKEKFGNEITISRPSFITDREIEDYNATFKDLKEEYFGVSDAGLSKENWTFLEWWLWAHYMCEESYMNMIKCGCTAQQARTVLNLDTKSELVHTAFISDWQHFFKLRCDSSAHPDARILAIPLKTEFIKKGYINE